ncbi:hypothetical protein ACBR55_10750 [Salinicoccus roseus]|uniref:hypothetical protein n=1 Tax=Salinicoccus roseus TaxID=45670 RepID=UPI0035262559
MEDRFIIYQPLNEMSNINFLQKIVYYYIENKKYEPDSIEECLYMNELCKYLNDVIDIKIANEDLTIQQCRDVRSKFSAGIRLYLENITEDDFINWLKDESRFYDTSHFLLMIEKYKLKSFVKDNLLNVLMEYSRFNLSKIIRVNWFVQQYKKEISDFIIEKRVYRILLDSLFDENSPEYIRILGIKQKVVNEILSEYITLIDVNLSDLELISGASARGITIDPRLKHEAKKRYENYTDEIFKEDQTFSLEFGVKVRKNTDMDTLIEISNKNMYYIINFNPTKGDEINDFDIMLNYLYYTKAYFTDSGTLIASHKKSSKFREIFETKGYRFFNISQDQRLSLMLNVILIRIMDDLMCLHSNQYLSLIKYFVEDILSGEYGIHNIEIDVPETKNQKEINTILVIGLEYLMKTYNYFVDYGVVEHDVLKFGYELPKIEQLKSQSNMYLSLNEESEMYNLAFLLFDNQSPLSYHEKYSANVSENNFYSIISYNKNLSVEEWYAHQREAIELLIKHNIIYIEENYIKVKNEPELAVWCLLYQMKSINMYYFNKDMFYLFDNLVDKGYAMKVNKLMTKDEALLFGYLYNNETYSNGPSLRNKYAHSRTSSNYSDDELLEDYYTILFLYTIIIMKMNDDCRIARENKSL